MAYTALQLITNSYYLSKIVSRESQVVTGDQIADGLNLLNELINFKSTDLRHIPYFYPTPYEFDSVARQNLYFIKNLLSIECLTFNIGPVRYAMRQLTRRQFYGQSRADNVTSLPFSFHYERVLGGANIDLYFVPDNVYRMKLMGKFALSEVSLMQDMSLSYDLYYLGYIRYELASMICAEYGTTFPEQAEQELRVRRKKIMDVSPPDLSINKSNYFGGQNGLNWGDVNIGNGYRPV